MTESTQKAKSGFNFQKIRLFIYLLAVIILPLIFGNFIPEIVKAFFYSLSISIKVILIFVLPFIIFSFIFSSLLAFESNVLYLILLLISCIFLSNLLAITTGCFLGYKIIDLVGDIKQVSNLHDLKLLPLWKMDMDPIITNQNAMFAAFSFGFIFSQKKTKGILSFAAKINKYANFFLKKLFMPIIPIFILGFIFKLEYEKHLAHSLQIYAPLFLVILTVQVTYIFCLYFVAAKFNLKKALTYIKNVLPATITGFTTVSSAASLPILILCSEKNTDHKTVKNILPACINTHTLGSAISMSILIMFTIKIFGIEASFIQIMIFIFMYAIAKFGVVAVPGGAIMVVTPILESHLHFTPDMIGLVTAIYMMFDPFGTASNVSGNGAFVILFNRILNKIVRKEKNI